MHSFNRALQKPLEILARNGLDLLGEMKWQIEFIGEC